MKYQIITFGCQFNKSDAERASFILEKLGYQETKPGEIPDLVFVLACSVRQSAVNRLYGLNSKWKKLKKRPVSILAGCVLKSDQKLLSKFFDFIIPSSDIVKLPKILGKKLDKLPIDYLKVKPKFTSKFSAYVPIMVGCNNFCAYCVVPYVRGQERCRPAKDIIQECQNLIKQGYKEIVLIGQNVNSYCDKKIDFPRLLAKIDELKGDYWLRFATSHPKDSSDELIKVMAKSKHITPYLHLPIQAGDDTILKKMNRRYTVSHYKNLIKKAKAAIPNLMVSTDVIVGFPGESKKQFENTAKLFKEIKFDMAYLAQYSPRAGTAAARLKDNVSRKEKSRREQFLNEILKETALKNNQKLIGQTVKVLVEKYDDGFSYGKTETFKDIKFQTKKDRVGQFVEVKVIQVKPFSLAGVEVKN